MANTVLESAGYKNLSASAQIKGAPGQLLGIFCASSSSGTVKVWDSLTAANSIIVNTFSVSPGVWYPMPAGFGTGLFVTIGGTADITVFFV